MHNEKVIALQPAVPSNPMASLLCTTLKVLNTLVIKQVHIPSRKLKATKPQPKQDETQAQQQH